MVGHEPFKTPLFVDPHDLGDEFLLEIRQEDARPVETQAPRDAQDDEFEDVLVGQVPPHALDDMVVHEQFLLEELLVVAQFLDEGFGFRLHINRLFRFPEPIYSTTKYTKVTK